MDKNNGVGTTFRIGRLTCVVLVLALCLCFSQGLQASTVVGDAITVTTRVTIDERAGGDKITLAGFADRPKHADSRLLELYWVQDRSGWFPTWQLELSSAAGLLPAGWPLHTRDGISAVVLAKMNPQRGHTYEVTLSYSAPLGSLSVTLYDVDAGKTVYADGFPVPTYDGPLHPLSGVATHSYTPVAPRWELGVLEPGGVFLSRTIYNRSEDATLRLQIPAPVAGEYRLYGARDDEEWLIAAVTPGVGEHRIPLDLTKFPLATSTLRLEHVDGCEVLFSETKAITVGQLAFEMSTLRPNRTTDTVETSFQIRAAEPYADAVAVSVHASLYELVWESESQTYIEIPYMQGTVVEQAAVDLSLGVATMPIELPIPERPAVWKVVLEPEVSPAVATRVSGNERLFSSHLPAHVKPGEPYTIVVLPDTQGMAERHPTIYTRMTEWIAANAAERSIVAVLHVGDITNHDTGAEWTNAYTSMSVLHGVVPYALTLGNHDMTGGAGVTMRGRTLINSFFDIQEARRYSNLVGTMVPDRLENHYHLFSIGDDDYLVIALEFGPPDEAVDWVNEIAAKYPDHRMILLTHSYLDTRGGLSNDAARYEIAVDPSTTVNTAFELWSKLVRPNANSFMVLSGHVASTPVVPYRIARAADGHLVFEFLFDWQAQSNGGNGWLGLLTFHPDNTLEVNVYSPYLGAFGQQRDSRGFTSHMLIDLETGRVQPLTY